MGTTDIPGAMSRLVGNIFVKNNFHRHALDHFDVIAHRIFRRQQTEPRAGPGLQAVHLAFELLVWISVHAQFNRLSRLHVGQLRFLEIGRHPNVFRNQRQQRLAGLHIISRLHRARRDARIQRRDNFCVGKIQFGLLQFGLGLLHCGRRGFNARLG